MTFDINELSPYQKAIMEVLADGLMHTKEELLEALPNPATAKDRNLFEHLKQLRKKLRLRGCDVASRLNEKRQLRYQYVRLIGEASPLD